MRIISGSFKGLHLTSVGKGDAQAHLRPTSDRVRESIFNLLQNGGYGDPVKGARVLDLFAGTGALGLEALSRGAARVVFVDNGTKAAALIGRNVALCRAADNAHLIRRSAVKAAKNTGEGFDLVFLDPPYGQNLGGAALSGAATGGWLADKALIVWEENAQQEAPPQFEMLDARRYGDTWVHILTYAA